MNDFIESIEDDTIISKIIFAIDNVGAFRGQEEKVNAFKSMIGVYAMTLDECFAEIAKFSEKMAVQKSIIASLIQFDSIESPNLLLSSRQTMAYHKTVSESCLSAAAMIKRLSLKFLQQ